MSENSEKTLFTVRGVIIDLVLSVIFFLLMRKILVPHVPSQDPNAVLIVSSMTSFCMTGVFWIAANMLRVTWVDYNRRKQQ
ncbi:MAG: hypothetical protein CMI24_06655 [Opitutae bacterium]|nr:hypothetical protein [Opitutae bacterium]